MKLLVCCTWLHEDGKRSMKRQGRSSVCPRVMFQINHLHAFTYWTWISRLILPLVLRCKKPFLRCRYAESHLGFSEHTELYNRCMADLRNAGDLSLRHASAQALTRFVTAAEAIHAVTLGSQPADSKGLQGLTLVLHRILMPQVKQGSADVNLAVRQASFLESAHKGCCTAYDLHLSYHVMMIISSRPGLQAPLMTEARVQQNQTRSN